MRLDFPRASIAALVAFCTFAAPLFAEVKVPNLFSDHMVLQRGQAVPIWGTAAPAEKVTVKFRQQSKEATADAAGKWRVSLDSLNLGEASEMTIEGEKNKFAILDVLVGEVWVGSGQSNMDGSVAGYAKGDPVLAALAAKPNFKIRLLKGGAGGKWQVSTSQSNQGFSALLYSFGSRLQHSLNVPVGLMQGAVGGTPSGFWLSEDMFAADEPCQSKVKELLAKYDEAGEQAKYATKLAEWEKAAAVAKEKMVKVPAKPQPPEKPGQCRGRMGNLFAAHIKPFVGYAIKGVLWDQGESGTAIAGVDQYLTMGALIRGWRKDWGQGDFPFLHVQKPSGGGCAWDPAAEETNKADPFAAPPSAPSSGNLAYREQHIRLSTYPQSFMVIATDLGGGIHPTNKSGYGTRAARVARAVAYGEKIEYYGPVYKSHHIDNRLVTIQFTHIGEGLAARHSEKLQGFQVAGADKVFHWADAKIEKDTVLLTCDKVGSPMAVRYAWGDKIHWANLFNKDGLPAQTFRTDNW